MLGMLDDVKVIEISGELYGAFTAKLLADMGADTLKIEPPGSGDKSRREPPFLGGEPHSERSSTYLTYNTNKKGITLDLTHATGRDLFLRLAKDADMVIESFPPGRMQEMGLGFDVLNKNNPKLILLSVTPFGQTGPYRNWLGSDLVEQALGGHLISGGDVDKEPLQLPLNQAAITVARNAAIAAMAAVWHQRDTGKGQHVDVSSMESMVQTPPMHIHSWTFTHNKGGRGGGGGQTAVMDSMHLKTADGYVTLATAGTGGKDPMDVWADFLEEPRLKDPKYKDPRNRRQSVKEMKELVEAKLATQKSHDFLKKAMAARLVVGVVQSPEEVVDCVHLAERGSWMVIDHPEVGTLKYPGTGFITQMGNPVEGSRPAPLLGQHNREIYCDKLGLTNDQLSQLTGAGII